MINLRRSEERGSTNLDWLDSRHSFSFGDYRDPAHMGFRALRVINEDRVRGGQGFGRHPHRDMEIITYVLKGVLEHGDSMGNGSVIRAGDVQCMSAGTGVVHSEYNHSPSDEVHFLQMWIQPDHKGLQPAYEQRSFSAEERHGRWCLVATRDSREGALRLNQDSNLYSTLLPAGTRLRHELSPNRHAWLQVARGEITLGDLTLKPGDGVALSEVPAVEVSALSDAELLLFDLS
ncbi:MAG: pirin family protein [Acidobacteriota bacterium]